MNRPVPPHMPNQGSEVSTALRHRFGLFSGVGMFSAVINLLALTGSLYMLQVYDRVIPSRSTQTLIGLTVLMLGLYLVNGMLDMLRARVMSRIGLKFDKDLRAKVFDIVLRLPLQKTMLGDGLQPIRDLDQIRAFMATPGPIALFDMPWMPFFILIIYWMHPWLGMLAIGGAIFLLSIAFITEASSRKPVREAAVSGANRHVFADSARRNAEVVRAMGMGARMKSLWLDQSRRHLMDQRSASDVVGGFGAMSKVLRMILQSAMLGLGAYLVILGEATAGVMIAGSILLSRALAPVEIAIANWRGFIAARQSYHRLKSLFELMPRLSEPMQLPPPRDSIRVQGLWVAAPGGNQAIVQNVNFSLQAGAGLGVIGASASGKSSLARALVGVWEPIPQRGSVRLDGASLDQWSPENLGRHIGYLPQDIELFAGTVAQNIARFDPEMTSSSIIAAARDAGVHDMILQLPQGYDTHIGEAGSILSAGQRQRVGLARALYGEPFLVVLDEPNSNLDAHGDKALAEAIAKIRARKGIAIVIAHRPSVLAGLDELLAMSNGKMMAFGPKEEVWKKVRAEPGAPDGRTGTRPQAGSAEAGNGRANEVLQPATEPREPSPMPHHPLEFWTTSKSAAGQADPAYQGARRPKIAEQAPLPQGPAPRNGQSGTPLRQPPEPLPQISPAKPTQLQKLMSISGAKPTGRS